MKKPEKHEEAEAALTAYDAAIFMHLDHVNNGFLSKEASRNFAMQAAITAVDQLRETGQAVIYVDEEDPIFRNRKKE